MSMGDKALKYGFSAIGLLLLLGSYGSYNSTKIFLVNAIEAEGVIIGFASVRSESRRNSSSVVSVSYTYAPRTKFKTMEGETVEFNSRNSSSPPAYSVGQKVKVLYVPTNPQSASIDSFWSLWGLASILGGIGLVFLLGGIFIFFMMSKRFG